MEEEIKPKKITDAQKKRAKLLDLNVNTKTKQHSPGQINTRIKNGKAPAATPSSNKFKKGNRMSKPGPKFKTILAADCLQKVYNFLDDNEALAIEDYYTLTPKERWFIRLQLIAKIPVPVNPTTSNLIPQLIIKAREYDIPNAEIAEPPIIIKKINPNNEEC